MQTVNCKCPIHGKEDCGLRLISTQQLVGYEIGSEFVPPFCKEVHKPSVHIYSYLSSRYSLKTVGSEVYISPVEKMADINRLSSDWFKEFYTPTSHIPLKPVTRHKNPMTFNDRKLADFVRPLARIVDRAMQAAMGIDVAIKRYPSSLFHLLRPKTSIESILCEPIVVGQYSLMQWYYATADRSKQNLRGISVMKEFATETNWRGPRYDRLKAFLPSAIRWLEHSLDCEKYVGTLPFRYSPRYFVDMLKMGTSGGIINSTSMTFINDDGITVKVVNGGAKKFIYEAAIREAHGIIVDIMLGREPRFMPLNVTKIKDEARYLWTKKNIEEMLIAFFRSREFYIPSLTLSLIAELIHRDRMKFERGSVITIGISGWWGGWYQLAVAMNYDNEELFWVDGDVKSLDKHIPDFALYLYLAAGSRYYAWKSFNPSQRTFLKRLYLLLMYHVTNKVTLQPGTIWRLIIGVMYSGGKETSHGDSWIMALAFFSYIMYCCIVHPYYSSLITAMVMNEFIRIIVYGDDHVWCCPKKLRSIINAAGFASFLKEFWGMELRDFKEYDSFVSKVDIASGVFIYKGPKFLKRYFIETFIPDSAPILPYKECLEPLVRMCTVSEEESYPGLLLKSIGQAWDSMGTNPVIYFGAKAAYEFARARCDETPYQIYMRIKNDPSQRKLLNSMMRKVHMTEDQFFSSFPSMSQLQSRHKFLPSAVNNKPEIFVM